MTPDPGSPPKFALRKTKTRALEPPREPALEPAFLVQLDPWHRTFLRNLTDLFWLRRRPQLELSSSPGAFWPDVFVVSRPPWGKFAQSVLCHMLALAALLASVRFWPAPSSTMVRSILNHEDVISYSPAEYLPPLDTGHSEAQQSQKGDPVYAKQAIISVPPEADNHHQTIVTPPPVKLQQDVPLPNIVAWSRVQPAVPLEATNRSLAESKQAVLPISVVEPAPDVKGSVRSLAALSQSVVAPSPEIKTASSVRGLPAPVPSVVAPPPSVDANSVSRLGDISIGHSTAVAPAPALPVGEQRAVAGGMDASMRTGRAGAVPPPPSISAGAGNGAGGRIIALGIHPAALQAPVEPPAGNRRGTFAAGPNGRAGASGTPEIVATRNGSSGTGAGNGKNVAGVPSGLTVGAAPGPQSSIGSEGRGNAAAGDQPGGHDSRQVADARVGNPSSHAAAEVSERNATDLDRQVFGDRKFYSMTLNMPNLNSGGGSWVIRFAEMQRNADKGELSAPVATQKVDPAYPVELMRHNVQGTVTLRAVIRSDGSVGEVSVLRGIDDRLDEYARAALERWRFQPGTKNGAPVDLEAVVRIPFRPVRPKAGF